MDRTDRELRLIVVVKLHCPEESQLNYLWNCSTNNKNDTSNDTSNDDVEMKMIMVAIMLHLRANCRCLLKTDILHLSSV